MVIEKFRNSAKFNVRGKINLGYKVIKGSCVPCKKSVVALKKGDVFFCPQCGGEVTPAQGEKEFTQSTPYFVLPDELKEILGERPVSLRVVPAYREIEKTFPSSYVRFTKGHKIFCTGNGVSAKRYDTGKKAKIDVPCSDSCPERLSRQCKPSCTFYVVLPDVDMFSVFTIGSHSEISIVNIMSTLNMMTDTASGLITRTVCTLSLIERERRTTGTEYYVLQLEPPRTPLGTLQGGAAALSIDWQPLQAGYEASADNVINIHSNDLRTAPATPHDDPERLKLGREKVKEKLKVYLKGSYVDRALEIYVCERYKAVSFEDISVKDLLEIYKEIGEDSTLVNDVMLLAIRLRHGVGEELPFLKTA